MKLESDRTTSFGCNLFLFVLGLLISGLVLRFLLFPATYEIYKWASLIDTTTNTDGIITELYKQRRLYRVAYIYRIQAPDGVIQRFTQDEFIDKNTYYWLDKGGIVLRVKYSVSNPALARIVDNTYMPWPRFFIAEIFGSIFFIAGLWLVFRAVGIWIMNFGKRISPR
jgi:hypothetical protein